MRLNKFLLTAAVGLVSASLFSSCLKDQDDVFPESSAERLQARLDKCKEVLTSSEYGWAFEYYPDRHLTSGGYIYTCKFEGGEVTAGFESKPGEFETSLYKLTNDNGPVLSFDTYNSLLHYFAIPSSGEYEAKDGDFEFLIMDVQDDVIKLRGNRNGNYAYMRRLTVDPETYMKQIAESQSNLFLEELRGTFAGQDIEVYVEPNRGSRYIAFIYGEGEDDYVETCFVPTPTGIRFMKPLELNGVSISELEYQMTQFAFTGVDSKGQEVVLQGDAPADYSAYDEFVGEFTMKYSNGSKNLNITIAADGENQYKISGLGNNFSVVATYNEARGAMEINAQQLGVDGNSYYWLCCNGTNPLTNSSETTWATDAGFIIKKDPNNPGTFVFSSNSYENLVSKSLIIWNFVGSVDEAGFAAGGQAKDPWRFTIKSAQMANLHSLVKK